MVGVGFVMQQQLQLKKEEDKMLKNNVLYRLAFPSNHPIPLRTNGWFGKKTLNKNENPPKDDVEIRPFTIDIDQSTLDDLKHRLKDTKLTESLDGTNFRYGFNSKTLEDIIEYWQNSYDWLHWQKELNTNCPQFKTQIEGIDIHFIHIRPEKPTGVVLPLLMIHGWPSSPFEFHKTFPLLTDGSTGGLSFEVIAPSIPGFGFSEAPHKEGFHCVAAARIFVKLMHRLGFSRFFVHGGDWGSFISKTIALMYPESVRGIHTTLHFIPNRKVLISESQRLMFTQLEAIRKNWYLEGGYSHIQATKPDTVGVALGDSPAGLAAYILEKFSSGLDINNVYKLDGGLFNGNRLTLDELLTNVMIYWFSHNVTSSLRFYRENLFPGSGAMFKFNLTAAKVSSMVPAAYAVFPNEIVRPPKFVIEMSYGNLIQYTELPRGGHFSALEEPQLLVDDIKRFARVVVSRL
ncbi:hypothetical protein RDWZM_006703 [Blomia tropicalis]|uniref:Epoxide hydrolase n=1 Tax=Blomia tropicalis TaxID=40697 RepID=A0A9Q0M7J3_BLOTA|nr:hypothetical protein RDWZM_006703 [Blomia tropicalis]